MTYVDIMQFLIAVEEVDTQEQLISELERLLFAYELRYYCLFLQPRPVENPASLIMASNWSPEWVNIYVQKKYILVDPTIRYLIKSQIYFTWSQAVEAFAGGRLGKRMAAMMKDGKNHGLVDGCIFPVHGRMGLLGALTVSGKRVDLSPLEMSLFHTAANRAFWRMLELTNISRFNQFRAADPLIMTHREIEVLNLLADGLTTPEVSEELGLSQGTVNFHMSSLQEKLKARNRQHIVATALRLGIIG